MDTGVSNSFVAASFVEKLNRMPEPMHSVCGMSLPSREDMLVWSWVRVMPVWVEGRELTVDLLILDLHEYDVILGMDWLSKYGAIVNYKKRRVVFKAIGEVSFTFQGAAREKKFAMISAITNMIYPEVFPDDLPGLLPEREVVFDLDIIPGMVPISKAPNQMALAELKELQAQL
ncbi:uncharacterized protein LOC133779150 [Humulus lupulus]|uniref:uncharacterized protein LOC133779150 n=1 Tax=Humulus lupulus TaxID=3486 RepID=UPI002B40C865|nr:uncharacterized protein LOC133779150 [Humulus lupulus]